MLKHGVYFFYWHDVSNDKTIPNGIRTSPKRFESEIKFIHRNFQIVTIKEAIDSIKKIKIIKIKKPLAVLCFDDGFKSLQQNVEPILSKSNIPFTMFLNTAFLDQTHLSESILCEYISRFMKEEDIKNNFKHVNFKKPLWSLLKKTSSKNQLDKLQKSVSKSWIKNNIYLSWDDLEKFNNQLVTFGNHTSHHLWLANLNKIEQEKEIKHSHLKLKKLSQYIKLLAIPFGSDDSYNNETLSLVKKYSDSILIKATGSINHKSEDGLLKIERIGMSNNKPNIERHIRNRLKEKSIIYKIRNNLIKIFYKTKLLRQ